MSRCPMVGNFSWPPELKPKNQTRYSHTHNTRMFWMRRLSVHVSLSFFHLYVLDCTNQLESYWLTDSWDLHRIRQRKNQFCKEALSKSLGNCNNLGPVYFKWSCSVAVYIQDSSHSILILDVALKGCAVEKNHIPPLGRVIFQYSVPWLPICPWTWFYIM